MTQKQKKYLLDIFNKQVEDYEHWLNRDDLLEKPCVMWNVLSLQAKLYATIDFLERAGVINSNEWLEYYDKFIKSENEIRKIKNHKNCKHYQEHYGENKAK